MKLRNPWIDPRVVQVRPTSARAYLLGHGWQALPIDQPNLLPFASPRGEEDPVVLVPLREKGRDYPQRVIELVTDLALAENRYAVEVLNDILKYPVEAPTSHGSSEVVKVDSQVS